MVLIRRSSAEGPEALSLNFLLHGFDSAFILACWTVPLQRIYTFFSPLCSLASVPKGSALKKLCEFPVKTLRSSVGENNVG